jgi:hypothetical protein
MSAMAEDELLKEVRRLRATGASPRDIARTLGVRPSVVAPLVRQAAAERPVPVTSEAEVVGCWVSPGWSSELLVVRREGWDDTDLGPDGPKGIALVLVARAERRNGVSVCGYLVDTFCLGVKNVIGPERMRRRDLPSFVRTYFMAFPASGVPAPIELAQHLVLGAVSYAETLGFSPHPEFERARCHVGQLNESCAISFGRSGHPLYVAGLDDDPVMVINTLNAKLGAGGFAVAA